MSPLSFPIPQYLSISEQNKDVFTFYIIQWIYTHNACPSDANIKDGIMPQVDHVLQDAALIIAPQRAHSKDAVAPQQVKSVQENDEETIECEKLLISLNSKTDGSAMSLCHPQCGSVTTAPIAYALDGNSSQIYDYRTAFRESISNRSM
eukprot:312330_1